MLLCACWTPTLPSQTRGSFDQEKANLVKRIQVAQEKVERVRTKTRPYHAPLSGMERLANVLEAPLVVLPHHDMRFNLEKIEGLVGDIEAFALAVSDPKSNSDTGWVQPSVLRQQKSQKYEDERKLLRKLDLVRRFDFKMRYLLWDHGRVDLGKANEYFKKVRDQEIEKFKSDGSFPPAHSFFQGKSVIENSQMFKILRSFPKFGLLHVHSISMGRAEVILEFTKKPECYVEWKDGDSTGLTGRTIFRTEGSNPQHDQEGLRYRSATEVRKELGDTTFETRLRNRLVMSSAQSVSNNPWAKFDELLGPYGSALTYKPLFDAYYRDAIKRLLADKVTYAELRGSNSSFQDLDGKPVMADGRPLNTIKAFHQLRDSIKQDPELKDFDFRFIMNSWRGSAGHEFERLPEIRSEVEDAFWWRSKYPDFVIGFDLVGHEDSGGATKYFRNIWVDQKVLEKMYQVNLMYFFHDGETDWINDHNLFDAFLLHSRRIGHGLNLRNFPTLQEAFKVREIAIEVCPISNQVLGFVPDLRLHPAATTLRRGNPMVIASDDPAFFGYTGLSYDFWEACMSWELDLYSLIQLALNSYRYSAWTLLQEDLERHAADPILSEKNREIVEADLRRAPDKLEKWVGEMEQFVEHLIELDKQQSTP